MHLTEMHSWTQIGLELTVLGALMLIIIGWAAHLSQAMLANPEYDGDLLSRQVTDDLNWSIMNGYKSMMGSASCSPL